MMFEDDTISIIPERNILDEIALHQSCTVKWTGGKRYQAEVLFVGRYVRMLTTKAQSLVLSLLTWCH